MDLYLLDYLSVNKTSLIHRLHPITKIAMAMFLISLVFYFKNIRFLLSIYLFLNFIILVARLPWHKIFIFSLYPLLFLILFIFAMPAISMAGFLIILLKVISITTTMILLFATTPYPCVFGYLGKVLPVFLVSILFLTYRSIFIILSIFKEVKIGFYLRAGFVPRRPIRSLKNISKAFGYLVIRAIDESQAMYEIMRLRGFKGKINHMGIH